MKNEIKRRLRLNNSATNYLMILICSSSANLVHTSNNNTIIGLDSNALKNAVNNSSLINRNPFPGIYNSKGHDTQPSLEEKQQKQKEEENISSLKEALNKADGYHSTLNHTNNAVEEKQRIKAANWKNVEYDVELPMFALEFTVVGNNNNDASSILKNATYNRLASIFTNRFQNPTQKFDHLALNFSIISPSTKTRRQMQQQPPQRRRRLEQSDVLEKVVSKVNGKAYFTGGTAPKVVENDIIQEAFADADTPMKMASDGLITRTELVMNPKFDSNGELVQKSNKRFWIWILIVGALLLKFILVALCVHICKQRVHSRRLRAEIQKRYSSSNAVDDDDFSFCDTDSDVETISMGEIEVSPSLRSLDSFWRKKPENRTASFGGEAVASARRTTIPFRHWSRDHKASSPKATSSNLEYLNTSECRHTSPNPNALEDTSQDDFSFAPTPSSRMGLSLNFSQDDFFQGALDDDVSASTTTTNREMKEQLEADQERFSEISTSIMESIEEMENNLLNLEKSIEHLAIEEDSSDSSCNDDVSSCVDNYSLSSTCVMTGV